MEANIERTEKTRPRKEERTVSIIMEEQHHAPLQVAIDSVLSAKRKQDDEKFNQSIIKLKYRIFQVIFRGKEHERLELLATINRLIDEGVLTPKTLNWVIIVYLTRENSFDVKKALMTRMLRWHDKELLSEKARLVLKNQLQQLTMTNSHNEMDPALVELLPQIIFKMFKEDSFTDELINSCLKSKHPHLQELALTVLSYDAQFRHVSPEKAVTLLDTLFNRMNIIVYQRLARQPDRDLVQWLRNLVEELEEPQRHELLAKILPFSALFSEVVGKQLIPMLTYLGKTRDREDLKQLLQYLGNTHLWKELTAQEKEELFLRLEEQEFPLDRAGIVMAIEGADEL